MSHLLRVVLSSAIIAFCSWLAGRKPALAGFLIALPIASMISIAMTQAQWGDAEKSVIFAKSILFSIPLSLTFFIPFLFARQLNLPFWGTYGLGIALLAASYGVHRAVFGG